jgi:putative addiction module component (TIGR02574 family)
MSQRLQNPPAGFDDLSVEEQIDYVQGLWEHIVAKQERVPAPAWHRWVLDARRAQREADPDAGRPWEQVEADLRKRLANRR